MRKKLLSLMALLLTAVTGAWAAEVDIFTATATSKWSVPASTSNADVSDHATIVGGTMTVYNGQSSAKDLILQYNSVWCFSHTNGNTMFKVTLPSALAVGDKISVTVWDNKATRGVWLTTSETYPSEGGVKINTSKLSTAAYEDLTYTLKATDTDLVGQTSFFIHRATNNSTFFANFKITRDISAPYVWKNPTGADYMKDASATALSVEAIASTGDVAYQWYSCTSSDKTGAAEIGGETSKTYTPSTSANGTFYYFCRVSDGGANTTDTEVATITVSAASAPTAATITPSPTGTVTKSTTVTLTADADGTPEPTYEWFQCDDDSKSNPVSMGTGATYEPVTSAIGTFYYYVVATNASGSVESAVYTLTVTGSEACQLISVKFSNGAYGAITEPTAVPAANGTVTVPYMSGESAPTVSTYEVSADATYVIAGSTITVTAEDGVTTAEYDITTQAMTPLAVADDIATTTFDAVPAWIFNPYGYDSSKGVKFAKAVNEASNMRISAGKTRQYYFIAAAKTLTLTSGSAAERDIKVYRNGALLDGAPTKTAENGSTIDIALDESAPCMITIESNQASGDGGFTKFAVEASTTNLTLTPAKTYTTLTSAKSLDFTGSDLTAYIVKDTDASDGITLTKVNKVPAGTGLIIKATTPGAAVNVPILSGAADDVTGNNMTGSATATTPIAANGGYILSDGKFHPASAGDLPAGKAYLAIEVTAPGIVDINFNDDNSDITTGIDTIEHSTLNIEHSEVYNLNGQRVSQPTKGLYIVNGKKVIVK